MSKTPEEPKLLQSQALLKHRIRSINSINEGCYAMKGLKTLNISLSAAIAIIGLAASPLLAVPNNGGSGTTQKDLENDGYKCERVSVNFKECTKSGKPTYWCTDSGDCQVAPKQSAPSRRVPRNFDRVPSFQ
jgi:hypothetical protein